MTQRKIALSIEEAADYTGIGRNTLRQLVEWKKLPVLKVGRLCNKGCRRDRKAGPSSYSSGEFQRSYRKDGKAWACDPEG